MSRTGQRLDLCFVLGPGHIESKHAVDAAMDAFLGAHITDREGWAGPNSKDLVDGGFSRIRIDINAEPRFYGNQVGGFRVHCPETSGVVSAEFTKLMSAHSHEPEAMLACPACGQGHRLDSLEFKPIAAFGKAAMIICDSANARLSEVGAGMVRKHLSPFVQVTRRI